MYLEFGFRSACCHAPIRMGKKKVKNTRQTLKVWVCTNCGKRDVDIVETSKSNVAKSTFAKVDMDDPDVLD